ncbi:MAG: hypothetical protein QM538_07020 [Methylacidiphilales bacterium]|nr:hypothetical protein [Candidatus Methylacidiphilales bacterium]
MINKLTLIISIVFLTFSAISAELENKEVAKNNPPQNKSKIYTFGGTNIIGVQEAAKSLVLVPWKSGVDWEDGKLRSNIKRFPIIPVNEELLKHEESN